MLSNSPLSSSSQSIDNKDADEVLGKGDDDLNDQERIDSSTKDVNTAGLSINTTSENINTGSPNINTASLIPNDSSMQSLENTGIFDDACDDREVGAEADLNNLETTMNGAFLYGTIKEEVYVCQPPGFEDLQFHDKVHKKDRSDILLVHVYVDDIIFGSTKKSLCVEFEQMMHKRFQMSSIGELTFFLGLQATSTPMEPNKALVKDEEAVDVDVHLYRSMIGSLMYLTTSRPDITFTVCACARF
ncbi:uncharacterized mitochondrial protein-like protein [Tanacetum coccineum]